MYVAYCTSWAVSQVLLQFYMVRAVLNSQLQTYSITGKSTIDYPLSLHYHGLSTLQVGQQRAKKCTGEYMESRSIISILNVWEQKTIYRTIWGILVVPNTDTVYQQTRKWVYHVETSGRTHLSCHKQVLLGFTAAIWLEEAMNTASTHWWHLLACALCKLMAMTLSGSKVIKAWKHKSSSEWSTPTESVLGNDTRDLG